MSQTALDDSKDFFFARRISHVCVCYFQASVVLQFGTALPDLRQLLAIDLEKASWLFTARSIGFLCGCLVYGLIYDRYNRLVIMAICSIGTALATLLIPFLLYYPVMVGLRFIAGFFCGGVDTGKQFNFFLVLTK